MSKNWQVKVNKNIAPAMRKAANRGVALAAEHVLGESNKTVPLEEGTLLRSGTVSTDRDNLQAAVAYDTPYSAAVHEDLTARHDPGRTAKFLENALNSEVDTVRKIIQGAIKGEL